MPHGIYLGPDYPLLYWPIILLKEDFLPILHGGRYHRFYSFTDRSNCAVTVTGGPFWTDPRRHQIDRRDRKN